MERPGSPFTPRMPSLAFLAEDNGVVETSKLRVDSLKGSTFVNQYVIVKGLGQGTCGKVKLCLNTSDHRLYAIKLVNKKTVRRAQMLRSRNTAVNSEAPVDILQEILVMKQLNHPNLVRLTEVIDDPDGNKLLMVMEYVEGGPVILTEGVPEDIRLSEPVARRFFRDILVGLDYLHFSRIVHSDLKPGNLLLSAEGIVKIGDFGSSRILTPAQGDTLVRTSGTPAFLAPEMCVGKPYHGRAADLWALGVCLYMFVYGEVPFKADTILALYEAIRTAPLILHPEPVLSRELKDLLTSMLEKEPEDRLTMAEIMAHPWVAGPGLPKLVPIADLPQLQSQDSSGGIGAWWDDEREEAEAAARQAQQAGLAALLTPLFEQRCFAAGSVIVREGDPASTIFYVQEGTCELCYSMRRNADEDFVSSESEQSTTSSNSEASRWDFGPDGNDEADDAASAPSSPHPPPPLHHSRLQVIGGAPLQLTPRPTAEEPPALHPQPHSTAGPAATEANGPNAASPERPGRRSLHRSMLSRRALRSVKQSLLSLARGRESGDAEAAAAAPPPRSSRGASLMRLLSSGARAFEAPLAMVGIHRGSKSPPSEPQTLADGTAAATSAQPEVDSRGGAGLGPDGAIGLQRKGLKGEKGQGHGQRASRSLHRMLLSSGRKKRGSRSNRGRGRSRSRSGSGSSSDSSSKSPRTSAAGRTAAGAAVKERASVLPDDRNVTGQPAAAGQAGNISLEGARSAGADAQSSGSGPNSVDSPTTSDASLPVAVPGAPGSVPPLERTLSPEQSTEPPDRPAAESTSPQATPHPRRASTGSPQRPSPLRISADPMQPAVQTAWQELGSGAESPAAVSFSQLSRSPLSRLGTRSLSMTPGQAPSPFAARQQCGGGPGSFTGSSPRSTASFSSQRSGAVPPRVRRSRSMLSSILHASMHAAQFVTSLRMSTNRRRFLTTRGPGQFVGEVSLFESSSDNPRWQTDVRAKTELKVLLLTSANIRELLQQRPEAEPEVRAAMAQRKAELLKLEALERVASVRQDVEAELQRVQAQQNEDED